MEKNRLVDFKALSLQQEVRSREYALTAAKLNYIPDITLVLGYTQRASIDGKGDFVGVSISFPLPLSGQKYSRHRKSVYDKYRAVKKYRNYRRQKKRDSNILAKES